jgi:hypothetical protein
MLSVFVSKIAIRSESDDITARPKKVKLQEQTFSRKISR